MSTLNDWNAYLGVLFDLAKIEDDLRTSVQVQSADSPLAARILFERYGVDVGP